MYSKIISSGRSQNVHVQSYAGRVATLRHYIGTYIISYYNIQRDTHPRSRYYNIGAHCTIHNNNDNNDNNDNN